MNNLKFASLLALLAFSGIHANQPPVIGFTKTVSGSIEKDSTIDTDSTAEASQDDSMLILFNLYCEQLIKANPNTFNGLSEEETDSIIQEFLNSDAGKDDFLNFVQLHMQASDEANTQKYEDSPFAAICTEEELQQIIPIFADYLMKKNAQIFANKSEEESVSIFFTYLSSEQGFHELFAFIQDYKENAQPKRVISSTPSYMPTVLKSIGAVAVAAAAYYAYTCWK